MKKEEPKKEAANVNKQNNAKATEEKATRDSNKDEKKS
jgi:hypothetical protein